MTEVGEEAQSALALAKYDEMGLELPPGLSFEDWRSIGAALVHMARNVLWWLGDWWRYGEREYGEAASQAAPTGYALQTVRAAAWVADRFSESSRRRDDLTWAHHREVAALPPAKADELLDLAEREDLSTRDLRQEVRRIRDDAPLHVDPEHVLIELEAMLEGFVSSLSDVNVGTVPRDALTQHATRIRTAFRAIDQRLTQGLQERPEHRRVRGGATPADERRADVAEVVGWAECRDAS